MRTSLEEQIDTYADIVARHPDDVNNLMLYGDANLKTGRRLTALSAYQKVIELDPENITARNKISSIYLTKNMYEEAYREIIYSLEQDPHNLETRFLLSLLQKDKEPPSGEISHRLDRIPGFQLELGTIKDFLEIVLKAKEDVEEQIKGYQEKLNMFPDDLYLEFELQVCLRDKHQQDELISFVKYMEEVEEEKLREEQERIIKAEEEERRREEEDRRRKEEEERRRREEEDRRRREEEEERRREEEEERRREEEDRRRKEEEERRVREEEKMSVLGEIFGSKLDEFASHKMVSEVLLVQAETGNIVKSSQTFSSENFADIVAKGVSFVRTWQKMDYWVIEYQQGLIFVKLIARNLILVVIGGIGSNFGALRFVIDRNEKNLIGTLRNSEFSSLLDGS